MRKSLLAVSLLLSLPAAAAAQPLIQSQEGIALQNEIEQLQAQVQQLQSGAQGNGGSALGSPSSPPPAAGGEGAPVAGGLVASLLAQVQQLQSQVQSLSGKVDELENQVKTQNAQMQKQYGDLYFRVTGNAPPGSAPPPASGAPGGAAPAATPSGASGSAPAQLAPPPPPAAIPPPAAPNDPKAQLHAALSAYGQHNYTQSAALAEALVKAHPQAAEAYRAQYLAAQSYAAAGHSQDAAIAYDNSYNMNRSGTYAAQSLLGLANALADIGANSEACSTLSSLNSQFPTPPAGMTARINAVSSKAHCQ